MSKKFLFVTDTHFRDEAPISRTDNIYKSQFAKLEEIMHLAHDNDVSAILHGGDFFNTKRPSYKLVGDIMDWCKHLPVPLYVVVGNHDITGYNLDSLRNSGLGVLIDSEAISLLKEDLVFQRDKIVIKPVPTSLNFEQNYQFDERYKEFTKVVISHNYIIPSDSMPFGFIHPKDVKTDANLVLCGHYHVPFDYSTETARWINPGSLCRWSIAERDRMPQVLLITIDEGKVDIETLVLQSGLPGAEVFNVEYVEQEKKRDRDIQSFVASLNSTIFSSVDIEEMVKRSGKDQSLEQIIIDEAVKRIRNAKEALK